MTNSTGSCVDLSTDLANQLVVWKNQIADVLQGRGWEPPVRTHVLHRPKQSAEGGPIAVEDCWVGDCTTKQH